MNMLNHQRHRLEESMTIVPEGAISLKEQEFLQEVIKSDLYFLQYLNSEEPR